MSGPAPTLTEALMTRAELLVAIKRRLARLATELNHSTDHDIARCAQDAIVAVAALHDQLAEYGIDDVEHPFWFDADEIASRQELLSLMTTPRPPKETPDGQ